MHYYYIYFFKLLLLYTKDISFGYVLYPDSKLVKVNVFLKVIFQCIDGLYFGLLSTVLCAVGLSVVLNELKLCHLHHPF